MNQAVSAEFFRFAAADAELVCPDSFVRPNDSGNGAVAEKPNLRNPRHRRPPFTAWFGSCWDSGVGQQSFGGERSR
jgi:hypothetical protein